MRRLIPTGLRSVAEFSCKAVLAQRTLSQPAKCLSGKTRTTIAH
jgi:hypothetical protein